MPETVISTITLTESSTTEEANNEAITDLAFVPAAPLTATPAAYSAAVTYAKGALVTEEGVVYRSQVAANKAVTPKGDTDFANWAPVGTSFVPLQNPAFGFPTTALVGRARLTPPASSAATASPSQTIGVESEVPLS